MTLGINAPALNAWDAPAGSTYLNDGGEYQYENIYVGLWSYGSDLYISDNTKVIGTGDAIFGYAAQGTLEMSYIASFAMGGEITIGSTYNGYVKVFAMCEFIGSTINVGTLGTTGELTVEGEDSYVNAENMKIGNTGSVVVEFGAVCNINNSLFIEPDGSLQIEGDGVLYAPTAEFGFGLNPNGIRGISVVSSGSIALSMYSTLAIVANEEYEVGKVFRLITGFSVSSYHWGDTVVASDTGQVFDIIYNNGGVGVAIKATSQVVPEPSTYALLGGVGAVALAVLRGRRRRG